MTLMPVLPGGSRSKTRLAARSKPGERKTFFEHFYSRLSKSRGAQMAKKALCAE
jgi:hypothetical protein